MLTINSVAVLPAPVTGPATARVPPQTPTRASDAVPVRNQGVSLPTLPTGAAAALPGAAVALPLPPVSPSERVLRAQNFDNAAAPERFQFSTAERIATQTLAMRAPVSADAANLAAPAAQVAGATPAAAELVGLGSAQVQAQMQTQAAAEGARAQPEARLQQQPAQAAVGVAGPVPERRPEPTEGQLPPPPTNPFDAALDSRVRELLPNIWSATRFAAEQIIGEEAREARAARAERLMPQSPTERALEAAAESYQRTSTLPEPPSVGVQVNRLI